jgi:ubiquinone/menaquinone biosynthesis C-methylase UbiE
VGISQKIISQGVEPHGALGWVTAWIMPVLSGTYCGDVAGLLRLLPDDEILDVACGSGVFLKQRAAHVSHVAGLDHSDIQLRMARKRNRDRIAAGTAEIVKGDATALPWPDDRFSAVTCNCVGCFAQPLESLKEMYRVLRPGGRAVLSFDYYPDEEKARNAEQRWGLPTWTEAEVGTLIRDAGFSRIALSHNKNNLFAKATKNTPFGTDAHA